MFVFFVKQKTASEMRINDWSSDVCSSDLPDGRARRGELLRSRQEEMRPRADRHRCVGRMDIPQPPEAARSQPAGIPWRLRNAVCRGFLGKYGYVTLFRGASRCELESAGR